MLDLTCSNKQPSFLVAYLRYQKSFPINVGSANLSSLLLFSRTIGSWDISSWPGFGAWILGTSSPTLLLYMCGMLTVSGKPLPAKRACPAPVNEGFVRVCDVGTGFFLMTIGANLSGAGTLCSSEKCFSDCRFMSSHPRGSGAAGGGEKGLITGDRPTCTRTGEATLFLGILTSWALCMYFAATGLNKDLAEVIPFGCLTGSFGPTGVRGVLGVIKFGDGAKMVTLSDVRFLSSTWRSRSCSKGSAKGSLS